MPEKVICPSCGHANPQGAASCEQCNFPLAGDDAAPPPPPARETPSPPVPPDVVLHRPQRRAGRRPPAMTNQQLSLWLLFAVFAAGAVIYTAIKANLDRGSTPVEGSNETQQKQADELHAALERDSNDVVARVALGNLLYDTGNWSDAIVHYRAAVRRDSTHAGVFVDLGVCYYNLGNSVEAERYFLLGLARDPHQPVALFNLGIVNERRADYSKAMDYFHRALQSGPTDEIKTGVITAMQRIQDKAGIKPPPLPAGGDTTSRIDPH